MKTGASKLRNARVKAGLTLEDAGERVGISHSQLSRYERGEGSPSLDLLRAIALAYRCPLWDVIDSELDFVLVTVVGKVAAGEWRDAFESPKDDQWEVPYMPRKDWPVPDGAMVIEGDSMDEYYPSGTVVFFKLVGRDFEPKNGMHVIVERRRQGEIEVTCKEIQLAANGQVVLVPRSHNPAFRAPIVLGAKNEDEEVVIRSVVTDSLKKARVI
jgi:transcriptional regulator with XRE-family HTH domain